MLTQSEKEKLFERIVTENRRSLQCFARNHADGEDCKDLEQEILKEVWTGLDRYKGKSSLKTWFHSVAVNTIKDFNRTREKAEKGTRILAMALSSRGRAADTETLYILQHFIQTLGEPDQTVLWMCIDRCRYQEISEATALDKGGLRMRVCRLRKKLSQYTGNKHGSRTAQDGMGRTAF